MGAGYVRPLKRIGFSSLSKGLQKQQKVKIISLRVGIFTFQSLLKGTKAMKSQKSLSKGRKIFENRPSKDRFFTSFVSLRVTFSPKFSLSKGQGPEVWTAHTRHPPTLVPPDQYAMKLVLIIV